MYKYRKNILPPPHDTLQVCVTIPAKNEEQHIGRALHALSLQYGVKNASFEVIVLINHSWDGTLRICKEFQDNHPDFNMHIVVTYSPAVINVGSARRELMDMAYKRLPCANGFVAMTDADSAVGRQWIKNLLKYSKTSIDLVCGPLVIDSSGLKGHTRKLYTAKQQYLLLRSRLESVILPDHFDPWPRHAFSCGPNMAIKKVAYKKIGGMPPLDFLEDAALYDKVIQQGLEVRHCPDMPVKTSARLDSRTERGFGDELKYWTTSGMEFKYTVEGLDKLIARLQAFKMLQNAYKTGNKQCFSELSTLFKLPLLVLQSLYTANNNARAMGSSLVHILENHKPWMEIHPNRDVFDAVEEIEIYFKKGIGEHHRSFSKALVHTQHEPLIAQV
ncbi:glycosyltransferase [Flavimarina sp. Hel_I_48]|uniref:glycosyltransferase n=1 Tax=Flavimarina sp. Hel_I_48 TaxID=1392488 RepID=UPI0004DF0AB8|nr:glycosyltransferase [Flavimarina sp. Hel_I_48]